jgi:two-component system NtrC family sensor kinase
MILVTVVVAVVPLLVMTAINYQQTRRMAQQDAVEPMRVLLNKTKHSFDLFLAERRSAVSYLAAAYSFEELADQRTLNRIFQVLKRELTGFVDLGLIDQNGIQVTYAGPYQLSGKDYSAQEWLRVTRLKGSFISDVFLGYRQYPHFAIAVEHQGADGRNWTIRVTLDTATFDRVIDAMALVSGSDAFLVNDAGVLQTSSRHYGGVLEGSPFVPDAARLGAEPVEAVDPEGQKVLIGWAHLDSAPLTLVLVRPQLEVLRSWTTLKNQLLVVLMVSVIAIIAVSIRVSGVVARRIEESERRQREAMHQSEHANKLASIGRLAAGVAHEINNPTAIIDQKAGLMKDLMEAGEDFPLKGRFMEITDSILHAVDRVRTITHRLLGFARRMDVEAEEIDLNELIKEVLGFLEREASYRNIDLQLRLLDDLPRIWADPGQLEQVFLNILTNSFAAVDDGGRVTISSSVREPGRVAMAISDNGCGMSEQTMRHIFEPFFTTKGYGTGLGLSITYGIVKRCGGEIEVESEEGRGTTFTVVLPTEPPNERGP